MDPSPEYKRYKRIFKGQRMPLVFVDLDKFDRNIDYVASTQAATGKTIRVHTKSIRCLELDMAYRPMNTGTHLGLRRSPLRRADQVAALALEVQKLDWVRISAMMGYEGHIAGPCDNVPGQWARNRLIRFLKKRSIREFSKRRTDAVKALQRAGADLEVVNGGGSGSLVSTGQEDVVTEVTAGSAFYGPATFWHYKEVSFIPSAFFAVQVVRTPKQGMVTCQGGGYAFI